VRVALAQTEVEERHASARLEEVVPRMRVAVERFEAIEAAEDEAEDRLAREVALVLIPCLELGEPRAGRQFGGQHASRAQRIDDSRYVDEGVTVVPAGEEALVARLDAVVELFGDAS